MSGKQTPIFEIALRNSFLPTTPLLLRSKNLNILISVASNPYLAVFFYSNFVFNCFSKLFYYVIGASI